MDTFYPKNEVTQEKSVVQIKNLIALGVVLTGLFIGSLFVDFAQLMTGSGFSRSIVREYDLLQSGGKTWVAYKEPKVTVHIITDEDCTNCDPREALVWLRRVMPTIEASAVESTSPLGRELIEQMRIVSLPAFIFSRDVTATDFYSQASSLFIEEEKGYFFDMGKIGLSIGKYLTLPEVRDGDSMSGPRDARVTIIEFSDFQCVYCKTFQSDLNTVLKEYAGKVLFVYKHLPLSSHTQAENASLASLCANEQGKFQVYADYLYTKQDVWGKTIGTQKFKDYAWWLGLDGRKFTTCLDTKKYQNQVLADKTEANKFSLTGTPSTFINGVFLSGAVTKDVLRQVIDEELAR
ncbi:MAG: thioredoxin domain-containing protein [Candidatus Moranbacteria bacterium]|nr:thioredoxin domain-containing protein [Candidatus Moranbacteria bacterium]MDD3964899.1 thioredoxin domain-containing protein [Candidatus Moranbacteria bacterium]